jgi:hypothetical protein
MLLRELFLPMFRRFSSFVFVLAMATVAANLLCRWNVGDCLPNDLKRLFALQDEFR